MSLKIEAARRQLGTALSLFLDDQDPVSVHCLASAGWELIEHAAAKAGQQPFVAHILNMNPGMDMKEVRRLQRQYSNAFKHATQKSGQDRADDELLKRFNDEKNDHILFMGWYDFGNATNCLPIEAQVQQVWYMAIHLEKVNQDADIEGIQRVFPDLRGRSRDDQKLQLRDMIAQTREWPAVMNDPMTDRRPLILPWP